MKKEKAEDKLPEQEVESVNEEAGEMAETETATKKETSEKVTEPVVNAEKLPDKEVKATEEMKKETTTSKGEYREANTNYLKSLYPDMEINDENYSSTMEKAMGEKIIPKMESYDRANTKFKQMMHSEPVMANVMADVSQGESFTTALPRYLDIASLELKPGDPDYTKWEENNKARVENYKASMDRKTQIENNQRKSEEEISKFFNEMSMDDDSKQGFANFVTELMDRAYAGEVTKTFLNKMYHAWKYEDDLKLAEETGTTKGRNQKIMDEKMNDEKVKEGDGLPVIDGGVSKERVAKPVDPFAEGLRKSVSKKSILSGNGGGYV